MQTKSILRTVLFLRFVQRGRLLSDLRAVDDLETTLQLGGVTILERGRIGQRGQRIRSNVGLEYNATVGAWTTSFSFLPAANEACPFRHARNMQQSVLCLCCGDHLKCQGAPNK